MLNGEFAEWDPLAKFELGMATLMLPLADTLIFFVQCYVFAFECPATNWEEKVERTAEDAYKIALLDFDLKKFRMSMGVNIVIDSPEELEKPTPKKQNANTQIGRN